MSELWRSGLWHEIDDILRTWGDYPVMKEVAGNGEMTVIGAPEFRAKISGIRTVLERTSVHRNDLVALFLSNSIDTVAIILSLLSMHAIPVFAKIEYRRVELTSLFRDMDPDFVLAERGHLPILRPFLPERGVLAYGDESITLEQGPPRRRHANDGFPDEIASINCTYRGSGELLGSITPEAQYVHGARVLQSGLHGNAGEQMLYSIPLTHIFTLVGCLFVPLLYRMTAVVARTIHPRILFDTIRAEGIQHITAVPEIYRLLLRARGDSVVFPSLRTMVSGGSTLEAEEYHRISEAFDAEVLHGYGLTEFTPVSRNCRGESRPGTVGPVCEDVDVTIHDADESGFGEILVRATAMSRGYYNHPIETKRAHRDGWFHTGDRGALRNGHLIFDSEIKETCKVNGVMVDLNEVRRSVLAASSAQDARIIKYGNSLTALLELADHADIEVEKMNLRRVLQHQLAAYKVPRTVQRSA